MREVDWEARADMLQYAIIAAAAVRIGAAAWPCGPSRARSRIYPEVQRLILRRLPGCVQSTSGAGYAAGRQAAFTSAVSAYHASPLV